MLLFVCVCVWVCVLGDGDQSRRTLPWRRSQGSLRGRGTVTRVKQLQWTGHVTDGSTQGATSGAVGPRLPGAGIEGLGTSRDSRAGRAARRIRNILITLHIQHTCIHGRTEDRSPCRMLRRLLCDLKRRGRWIWRMAPGSPHCCCRGGPLLDVGGAILAKSTNIQKLIQNTAETF